MISLASGSRNRQRGARLGAVLLLAMLATWLSHRQMAKTQMLTEPRARLESYLEGEVARPFSYRVLVPRLVGVVATMVPESVGAWVCGPPIHWQGCSLLPKDAPGRRPYFALGLVLTGSLLVYSLTIGHTCRRLYRASERAMWLAATGSLALLIPFVLLGYGHIYDFTVLALFAGMLYALLSERLTLFLLLFVVSCWNKETTILATVAYVACYFDRLAPRRFFSYLALQVFSFGTAYGTLRFLFRHNPGAPVETWYREQFTWFMHKPVYHVILLAGAALVITLGWSEKPGPLRRALVMLGPHLAMVVYGAQPREMRNFYESLPVVSLFLLGNAILAARTAVARWRNDGETGDLSARPNQPPPARPCAIVPGTGSVED